MRGLICGVLGLVLAAVAQEPRGQEPRPVDEPSAAAKGRRGGWLGLYLREAGGGVQLEGVLAGSEAEALGFKKGDIVRSVNGQRVRNGDDFLRRLWSTARIVARAAAAPRNVITVERGGERVEIAAGLDDLDAKPGRGEVAPDFTLKTADGKREVTLSKLAEAGRPVVLVFGSFT